MSHAGEPRQPRPHETVRPGWVPVVFTFVFLLGVLDNWPFPLGQVMPVWVTAEPSENKADPFEDPIGTGNGFPDPFWNGRVSAFEPEPLPVFDPLPQSLRGNYGEANGAENFETIPVVPIGNPRVGLSSAQFRRGRRL